MSAIVRVHHPALTPEEREFRIEKIKQAAKEIYREVKRNEAKSKQN